MQKVFQRYCIISLALFFTLFQSVHILQHGWDIQNSENPLQDASSKKHLADINLNHDCPICQFHFYSTSSGLEIFEFGLTTTQSIHFVSDFYSNTFIQKSIGVNSLRGPPANI